MFSVEYGTWCKWSWTETSDHENLKGWSLPSLSRQPDSLHDCLHGKKAFPYSQLETLVSTYYWCLSSSYHSPLNSLIQSSWCLPVGGKLFWDPFEGVWFFFSSQANYTEFNKPVFVGHVLQHCNNLGKVLLVMFIIIFKYVVILICVFWFLNSLEISSWLIGLVLSRDKALASWHWCFLVLLAESRYA